VARPFLLLAAGLAALVAAAWFCPFAPEEAAPATPGSPAAAEKAWHWSDAAASLFDSLQRYEGPYQVEAVRAARGYTIRVSDGDAVLLSWTGHDRTVFRQQGDVLYYADFEVMASGCTLVAFDLKARRQLWRTPLQGLGPIEHSKYHNAVNLDVADGAVTVSGKESAGRYVERVDARSGRTVRNQVLPRM
jgi:hypothetical protein